MSKDPMSGLNNDKDRPPIDKDGAEDVETKPPRSAKERRALSAEEVQKLAEESPSFDEINRAPPRFMFIPNQKTKITNVTESLAMALCAVFGVQPPEKGGFQGISIPEPYYDALSDSTQEFFHRLKEEAPAETPTDTSKKEVLQ